MTSMSETDRLFTRTALNSEDGMSSISKLDQLFTRIALKSEEGISSISKPEGVELSDVDLGNQKPVEPKAAVRRPRAIGSPLPMGISRRAPLPEEGNGGRLSEAPPLGRALAGAAPAPADEPSSSMQRIISSLRSALPLVQRFLPLLDGSIAATVSNLLAPHPHSQASAPAPKVDLAPIEEGLAALQTRQSDLRDQVMEQNTSLKRVEDQLEMVREATDRNTLEQQELLEDLKTFGSTVKMVVIIALGLVAIGFILNLILFLHVQRVLP